MTGLAAAVGDKNETLDWYRLQSEAIEKSDAILAKNNFTNFPNGMKDPNGLTAESYDPEGNTLYVTPNYLKYEHIKLSPKSQAKMNHLKLGEYGLILPEKLKADTKKSMINGLLILRIKRLKFLRLLLMFRMKKNVSLITILE